MTTQRKAYFFAMTAIFFWSTVATAFKVALARMDFLHLLLISSFTTVIVLFVILILQYKLKEALKQNFRELLSSAGMGFLNPFLYYVVLLKAYSVLPAQVAQPLNYTWPIVLVFLAAPLLGHKIGANSIIALIVSFIGVFVIATEGNILGFDINNPFGASLAAGSSIIWSFFWIFNVRDNRNEIIKLFWNFIFGFIYILITILFTTGMTIPGTEGILSGVYVGIFEMGITFVLWLKAMQLTSTTDKISNFVFLSPFISLIFIHFILGENIYFTTFVGLLLIIGGIFIQQTGKKKSVV